MMYLIDAFSSPPMVVLMTDDIEQADNVGAKYATQVGRPILLADGPTPAEAQFLPVIPQVAPSAIPSNPADIAPVPAPVVSFNPDLLTAVQRATLEAMGIKTS
jgi:hypothetical protein